MIFDAPEILDAHIAPNPTPPQPNTATVSPSLTFRVLNTAPEPVCKPQPRGASCLISSCVNSLTTTQLVALTNESFAKLLCPKNCPPISLPSLLLRANSPFVRRQPKLIS